MKKHIPLLLLSAGGVLALDQIVKNLVVLKMDMYESWVPIPALENFFRITRSYNTGAAFSIFGDTPYASDIILGLAAITSVVFIFGYFSLPLELWVSRMGIGMVIGGAVSNAIDRIRFDHVVDFFHVQLTYKFSNISNFADHAITIGVILLFLDQWQHEKRLDKKLTALVEQAEMEMLDYAWAAETPIGDDSWLEPETEE